MHASKSANISSNVEDSSLIHYPVLSVVIPAHERAYYLHKCLDSLFKQNYPLSKYEVIVIVDSSDGNAQKVLDRYLKNYPNLQVIRNAESKGSCYARNLGVKRTKGKVVVFTDSDCILPPDWLHKIARKFENRKVLCVQGTQECKGKWGKFMYEGEEAIRFMKKRRALDTKNLAIRRDLILQYKFDRKMLHCGDYELGQRLSKDIEILYDPDISVSHVCDSFSMSIKRGKTYGNGAAYICKKHGWGSVNPKFKYPIVLLFFYYLGSLFYFSLKYRSLRGGIAFFTTTFLTALHFKRNLARPRARK